MKHPKALLSVFLISFGMLIHADCSSPESCLLFSITSLNKARVGIVNSHRQRAHLKISNSNGDSFYNKSVPGHNNFFQIIDLEELPDGKYSVTLSVSDIELQKRFVVSNDSAMILTDAMHRDPIFKFVNNEALILNYRNGFNETVNIFIMQNEEVLFEDRGLTDDNILKKYSLKELPRGSYTVKVYAGSRIYTHTLEIE